MILVAGGTGTLGRELVSRLTRAHDVRVLTRDPQHAADLDVDLAIGDVRDASTLAAAVAGCSTVISAVHGFTGGRGAGPAEIDDGGNANLIRASAEAGVEHFVLMSVFGARPGHPMSLFRAKYAAEQSLYASGLEWTVLRPTAFVETWTAIVGAKLGAGGPAMVFGRGANPINFVSVQDVAAVAERAVTDPELRREAIDVPGPRNLTMTDFAQSLGAQKIKRIPRGALRLMSVAARPLSPAFARQARAAVVMDTTDMTADATALHARFPDISWHTESGVRGTMREH